MRRWAYIFICAAIAGAVCWARFVRCQGVRAGRVTLCDADQIDMRFVVGVAVYEALGRFGRPLSSCGPNFVSVQIRVSLAEFNAQSCCLLESDASQLLEVVLGDGRGPIGEEGERVGVCPALCCIAQLLDERLDVGLVVEVVGVDGSMTDEISCACDVAASGGSWINLGIMRAEVRSDTGKMVERIELVGCRCAG